MTRRRKCPLLARRHAGEHIRARTHAAADKHRLSDRAQRLRNRGMARTEGPGRALAMDVKLPGFAVDAVRLDLAGIVRNIEEKAHLSAGKEMLPDAPREMTQDLSVRQC